MRKNRIFWTSVLLVVVSAFSYRFIPYKIESIGARAKIGAHRVNSLDKLKYAQSFFDNIELDLVFDVSTKIFDVNHPPSKSIQLSFEEYIQKLENKDVRLWLDIKNLTLDNSIEILLRLEVLINKYGLRKDNLLIESRYPEALATFIENKFICSYYLPFYTNPKTDKEVNRTLSTIRLALQKQPTMGISTHYENYELIHNHFPNSNKYIWALSRFPIYKFGLMKSIKEDPTVQMILLHYSAPIGNR